VKLHAFKVVPREQFSLDQVLTHINNIPLRDRLRTIVNNEIRLEVASKTGQIWALDFGGLRPDGPGRASPESPISDFDMAVDKGLRKKLPPSLMSARVF
jgi:hypothetical protein